MRDLYASAVLLGLGVDGGVYPFRVHTCADWQARHSLTEYDFPFFILELENLSGIIFHCSRHEKVTRTEI